MFDANSEDTGNERFPESIPGRFSGYSFLDLVARILAVVFDNRLLSESRERKGHQFAWNRLPLACISDRYSGNF